MAEPAVLAVIREFNQELRRRERAQFERMADEWVALERRLFDLMQALAQDVADRDATPTFGQLAQMERYRALLRQLRAEMGRYVIELEPVIVGEQTVYARMGGDAATQALEAYGVRAGFDLLPTRVIENMVGLAGDGSPLRKLLDESWPESAERMTTILIQNTALGRNPRTTAREMRKATEGALDRMMRIARTEQLRVYRTASLDSYKASGVVSGYKRKCTLDRRTCAACLMDDGRFYELNEPFSEHVSGRCAAIPVIPGIRNVEWKQGEQWFLEQPSDVQREILGAAKHDAWSAGAFSLQDIIRRHDDPVWGPSIHPATLQQLVGTGA